MVVLAILSLNLRPLLEIENFLLVNLTYSYSFLGWNLLGITMALESFHNYFKSRKNVEKFGICQRKFPQILL